MKVAFPDFSSLDYNPLSPTSSLLGGMQSGIYYLSRCLARRGHQVYVLNNSAQEGSFDGVRVLTISKDLPDSLLAEMDVFVSIYCDSARMRALIGDRPLLLYTGHNAREPTVQKLVDLEEQKRWDLVVLKSNWQAESFKRRFALPADKIRILTNAVSPFYAANPSRESFFFADGRAPVLYYSSTPFRGLTILLRVFPLIRSMIPGIEARIYSSMAPYQKMGVNDAYGELYRHVVRWE